MKVIGQTTDRFVVLGSFVVLVFAGGNHRLLVSNPGVPRQTAAGELPIITWLGCKMKAHLVNISQPVRDPANRQRRSDPWLCVRKSFAESNLRISPMLRGIWRDTPLLTPFPRGIWPQRRGGGSGLFTTRGCQERNRPAIFNSKMQPQVQSAAGAAASRRRAHGAAVEW